MTILSAIITPSNILTAGNVVTLTNKTIDTASNTLAIAGEDITTGTVGTARLATGTADGTTYLRGDSTWAAAGLTYFTDSEDTAGVNATVPVNALTVANAGTNVDVALVRKGTGAILAQIPDDTVANGAKRGPYAVDWQIIRSTSSRVASGSYSVISGGRDHQTLGTYAVVSGGYSSTATTSYTTVGGGVNNTSSGTYATIAGGAYNTAGGVRSIVGGYSSSAYGADAIAFGNACVSNGEKAVAMGTSSWADGSYSTVLGVYGDARARYGCFVIGGLGSTPGYGHGQTSILQVGANTTDATPTVLASNASLTTYLNQNRMDTNSAYAFKALLVAGVTGGGNTKAWELTGCVKRGASGVPILVGTSIAVIAADAGTTTWDCALVVDTDAFTIQATGQAGTTIRWSASIYSSEFAF